MTAHPTRTAVPAAEDVAELMRRIEIEAGFLRGPSKLRGVLAECRNVCEQMIAIRQLGAAGWGQAQRDFERAQKAETENAALRARVAELEGVIAGHNKRCERMTGIAPASTYMIDTRVKGAV